MHYPMCMLWWSIYKIAYFGSDNFRRKIQLYFSLGLEWIAWERMLMMILNWILEILELRIYSIDRSILNLIKLSPSVVRLIVVHHGSPQIEFISNVTVILRLIEFSSKIFEYFQNQLIRNPEFRIPNFGSNWSLPIIGNNRSRTSVVA